MRNFALLRRVNMILHLIERYYIFYWGIFLIATLLKFILAIPIEGNPNGMVGIFILIFRWYSSIELSMIDSEIIKSRMRFQNLLTIGMIISLLVIGGVYVLKSIF